MEYYLPFAPKGEAPLVNKLTLYHFHVALQYMDTWNIIYPLLLSLMIVKKQWSPGLNRNRAIFRAFLLPYYGSENDECVITVYTLHLRLKN